MYFHSLTFAVFLFLTYSAYWRLRRKGQNLLLLVASYVFYGFWDYRFLGLIALSTVADYAVALQMPAAKTPTARKRWLALSLSMNLGLLFVFKYFDFFSRSFASLIEALGFRADPFTLAVILPVGISFYTFQTLSYTIDCYRGRIAPSRDPIAFAAFVTFFPQLVAGPIERATHLLPQFLGDRHFSPGRAADGCRQILYGLLIKTVVADNLATVVDTVYGRSAAPSALDWVLGTYAFAFQIYCDFAGYSSVAIGTARLFGFDLTQNFRTPYFSASLREFWSRWHISLSTWFRDYVYIPLGGNQLGAARHRINLMITFLVSGLWHGAMFTFVAWGFFHGLLLVVESFFRRAAPAAGGSRILRTLFTFNLVCVGWVFFRSADVTQALQALGTILTGSDWGLRVLGARTVLFHGALVVALVGIELAQREHPHGFWMERLPKPARWAIYYSAAIAMASVGRIEEVPFIYFQF
jgi:alginate O-acetyltransferase complex protein AlgI